MATVLVFEIGLKMDISDVITGHSLVHYEQLMTSQKETLLPLAVALRNPRLGRVGGGVVVFSSSLTSLKFVFFKKVTKIDKIFTVDVTLTA